MKMRWLMVMAAAWICALAGCRTAAVVEDSQLSGVFTRGQASRFNGGTGFNRPYLELDLAAGKLIVEESDETIWSSPCRRDGDRLLIAEPKSKFPAELRIGEGPVLTSRQGWWFPRVTATYLFSTDFPRRVGKPVPPEAVIKLDREAELSPEQRQLLRQVHEMSNPHVNFKFGRIELLTPDRKTILTTLDIPGGIETVELDPARPEFFLAQLGIGGSLEIWNDHAVIRFYPPKSLEQKKP